jgi:acyl-CoA thioesterase-1
MKILCLGDSLTYGFGMPRACIWTTLAGQMCGAEFVNRAINGNTTGGMMAAFYREVEAASPHIVLLMGGGNDIMYGENLAGARANMGGMAHMACAAQLLPVIGIPTGLCQPIREDWAAFLNLESTLAMWQEYTDWLRKMCATFGFPSIDFAAEFPRRAAQRGGLLREYYLEDGLHPNREGHRILAEIAAEALTPILQKN